MIQQDAANGSNLRHSFAIATQSPPRRNIQLAPNTAGANRLRQANLATVGARYRVVLEFDTPLDKQNRSSFLSAHLSQAIIIHIPVNSVKQDVDVVLWKRLKTRSTRLSTGALTAKAAGAPATRNQL